MRLRFCLCLLMFCGPLVAMTGEAPTEQGGSPSQAQAPPPQAAPTTQPSAAAVATNAATTTTPASGASPPQSNKPDERTADENLLRSRGYHREVHDGQARYCRREVTLGSRFEKKVCGSVEQLVELIRLSREQADRTMRQGVALQPNPVLELGKGGH